MGTWKCAGTASLYQIGDTTGSNTLAQPSGGGNGTATTNRFVIPSTASNATLSSNINTALGTVTGASKSYTSPTITLTATTPGSTGITAALDGAVTGVTVTTTTPGSDGTNTGTNFSYWSGAAAATTTTVALNIATAITRNTSANVPVNAASSTNAVTVTDTTAGTAGNSISLATNVTNFTWASSTLIGGTATGLCGANPTVHWSYNTTSAGGTVVTSPVLSEDGTMLAFVESAAASSVLHLLRPQVGDGTNVGGTTIVPIAPAHIVSNWNACTVGASCEINLTYSTGAAANSDTNSSPYYDYAHDALYVGNNNGQLYKIAPVFNGGATLPGIVSGWPVSLGALILTSPVFDNNSGNVFVGDSGGTLRYAVDSTHTAGGTTITGLTNITDSPVVDSSTGRVFAFTRSNGSNAAVLQATTALASPVTATVGTLSGSVVVWDGNFDNNYYTGADTRYGFLYVCGNPGGTPTLYKIGFNSSGTGAMIAGAATPGPPVGTGAAACSPLAEIFNSNTGTDWLAAGVTANCAFGSSTTGCVQTFAVTGWRASTTYTVGQTIVDSNFNIQLVTAGGVSLSTPPTWNTGQFTQTTSGTATFTNQGQLIASAVSAELSGTSGIVIDNVSTSAHNSSLYFSTLGAGGCSTPVGGSATNCAVKATQAGLH